MAIKQLVAWTSPQQVALKKSPTSEEVLKKSEELGKALEALTQWLSKNKLPKLSVLEPLIDLFGYDPYTGEHYRAVLVKKPNSVPEVGKTLVLRVSENDLSSWTQTEAAAQMYAREVLPDYEDSKTVGWAVVKAEASLNQVMTPEYAQQICRYIQDNVDEDSLVFDAEALSEMITRYKNEKEVLVQAPNNLRVKVLHAGTF